VPRATKQEGARVSKGTRTRTLIKDAIVSLAHRKNWHDVTLVEICESTGLTAGAFYFHFASKDEAMEEIAIDRLVFTFANIEAALAGVTDMYVAAHTVLRSYYDWYLKEPTLTPILYSIVQARPNVYKFWLERRRPLRLLLQNIFLHARQAANVPTGDEEFLSHWLMAAAEDFLLDVFFSSGNTELNALAGNADTFVRVQANAWYRAVMGAQPDHPLSKPKRAAAAKAVRAAKAG